MSLFQSLLFLACLTPRLCIGQESVDERRDAAFLNAQELSRPARDGEALRERALALVPSLKDEDVFVRAFTAFGLQWVSRNPGDRALAEELRERMREPAQSESSPFVKPWLERGLDAYRPILKEQLERVRSEQSLLDFHLDCGEGCSRVDIASRTLDSSLGAWQSYLDQRLEDLEKVGDRNGYDRFRADTRIGRALVCLPIRILDAMRAASPGTARNRKLFWRQP